MISPSNYVQGEGELKGLAGYAGQYGTRGLVVTSASSRERIGGIFENTDTNPGFEFLHGGFGGECTRVEINRLLEMSEQGSASVIIGIGGGKAIDTAKAVASIAAKPVIIVPTIASTDAPTSRLSIIYTREGRFEEYFHLSRNPDLVLVDTEVISKAPVRFLVAGMGDALATFFEARSCLASGADNMPGGKSTKAAFAIARTCYETLLEDSVKAKAACESNTVTPALENIIEANILLSGLGFESSGLAASHSVHDGLTVLEETHSCYHGEKVAFGVLVHLVLENAPRDELDTVIEYCTTVGLPTSLKELNITEVTDDKIQRIAEAACAEGETIHNMPFQVTPDEVFAAILAADKLGKGK